MKDLTKQQKTLITVGGVLVLCICSLVCAFIAYAFLGDNWLLGRGCNYDGIEMGNGAVYLDESTNQIVTCVEGGLEFKPAN